MAAEGLITGSQTSTYYSVGSQRSDADLQAAARVCDWRFGIVRNGSDTPDAYRQCMLAQGWEYGYTTRDNTYPDPWHPGLSARTREREGSAYPDIWRSAMKSRCLQCPGVPENAGSEERQAVQPFVTVKLRA